MGTTTSRPAYTEHKMPIAPPLTRESSPLAQVAQEQQLAQEANVSPLNPSIPPSSGASPFLALPRELRQVILISTITRADIESLTTTEQGTVLMIKREPGYAVVREKHRFAKQDFHPELIICWATNLKMVCRGLKGEMGIVLQKWLERGMEEEFEFYSEPL